MEPKKYGRHVLLDLCGGTEESVRSMFPHLVLKDDGLWLDPHAAAALALAMDEQDARGPAPDLDLLRQRRQEAGRGGWTWSPTKSSGGPVLPIPYTARELAAFILAGDGMALYDQFDFGAAVDEGQLKPLPTEGDAEAARSNARAAREAYRAAGKRDAHEAWRQAASATRAACWTVYYAGPGKAKRAALRASFIEDLNAADREAHKEFEASLRDLDENADEAREVIREAVALRVEADAKFGRTDDGVRAAAQWLLAGAPPEHVEDHAEQLPVVVEQVSPTPTPTADAAPDEVPAVVEPAVLTAPAVPARPGAGESNAALYERARELAKQILERWWAKDLYPPQTTVADEVAEELRKQGLFGAGGKPLTGATIKRHALKGISSAAKKAVSTTPQRGK